MRTEGGGLARLREAINSRLEETSFRAALAARANLARWTEPTERGPSRA